MKGLSFCRLYYAALVTLAVVLQQATFFFNTIPTDFRKMEGMLQREMDISSTLRAELEQLKLQHAAIHENDKTQILTLQKYVPLSGAVDLWDVVVNRFCPFRRSQRHYVYKFLPYRCQQHYETGVPYLQPIQVFYGTPVSLCR